MANAHKVAYYAEQGGHVLPAQVVKRDGRTVAFDIARIEQAVTRCYANCETPPKVTATEITERVALAVSAQIPAGELASVERVQDTVEIVLQSAGEFEAAKRYILHRAERANDRDRRDVPDEIRNAFADAAQYFPTEAQQFMFFDKYSKYNYDLGRRETWIETVDRSVDFLRELSENKLPDNDYHRIRTGILNMQAMPSMRMLATAGEYARSQNLAIFNCFAGTERYLTPRGHVTFAETAGTTQTVLNGAGKWVRAEVYDFGVQSVQRVTLRPGRKSNLRHSVTVTPDHRWITQRGEVTDLQVGDRVSFVGATSTTFNLEAWIAGFGFGDGTIDSQGNARVRLCGDKDMRWIPRFKEFGHNGICYPPSCNGDAIVTFHHGWFSDWKKLPEGKDAEWLASWLEGYLAADGHANPTQPGLSSQDNAAIEFVKDIAPLCGYMVTGHNVSTIMETNLGTRKHPLQRLTLRREGEFWVTAIEQLDEPEMVFCVLEPETHEFVLANGIHTGNCSYLPVKDLEAFCEGLLISMSGCGVGYSVESYYVDQLPRIKRQKKNQDVATHFIMDTTDGWITALRLGLATWFNGEDVEFDYSTVRRAGLPLRRKGGRASGPAPLRDMLNFCRSKIFSRQGQFLRTLDAHDMMCAVGQAAVSGGVRRTAMISLFDWDDYEMRTCKEGVKLDLNPIRWNANNSAVWPEDLTQQDLIQQMLDMDKGKRGEPGIFSRENAVRTKPARRKKARFGTNPCGEIILRPHQVCNLSIAVAREDDTFETLKEKVELATIIGTIQSMATHFPGLREEWAKNQIEERLLGVDILGMRDSAIASDPQVQAALREHAVSVNAAYAETLGINASAGVTCDKPGGNSSQLLNASSGISARHSQYTRRNMRVSGSSPVYRALKEAGVPMNPENGQTVENATTWVIPFPIKSPENATLSRDLSAVDQLDFWLQAKTNWTEHNPSATIVYSDDEFLDVIKWVWSNKYKIGGLSFLPRDNPSYEQLPYEEITDIEYKEMAEAFPTIDFSKIFRYELADMTTATQELSCFAGSCEL